MLVELNLNPGVGAAAHSLRGPSSQVRPSDSFPSGTHRMLFMYYHDSVILKDCMSGQKYMGKYR